MDEFSFVKQSEENFQYDEWRVRVSVKPEIINGFVINMSTLESFLTPLANINGDNIIITAVNMTGTNFSFRISNGKKPLSYQIKIDDYFFTYHYDKKTWTYSVNDKDFRPASKINFKDFEKIIDSSL